MSEGLYPPFALDFRTHVAQLFSIHPRNPQVRLLRQAAHILDEGGIGAIPTDSSYALACHLDDKHAVDRIRQLRRLDERHLMTLLCRDLSEIARRWPDALAKVITAHHPMTDYVTALTTQPKDEVKAVFDIPDV